MESPYLQGDMDKILPVADRKRLRLRDFGQHH